MNAAHEPTATPSNHYDAAIVGAGPAGSAIAASLAAQGWRVLLLERDRLPRHKVCGEFLSPEAQKTLENHGLYDAIAALNPLPLQDATLTGYSGRTLTLNLPGTAWGISRYRLDAALATAAQQRGAHLWCGTTVTGWQPENGGMVVRLRQRQDPTPTAGQDSSIHTRALVLACGRHGFAQLLPAATTRQSSKPARSAHVGIKCHFTNLAMPNQVELYLFKGGYIGINPIEDHEANKVNVCALTSYDSFAQAGRSPSALIAAAAKWNPAFGQRLAAAQPLPATECAVAPVDTRRPATPWQGLPLLGDTAAMIAPLVGDGMAMALRSAELCAPLIHAYLQGLLSWQQLGQRYTHLWHSEFNQRITVARLLETMLQNPRRADLLFQLGATLPPLANYLLRATRSK